MAVQPADASLQEQDEAAKPTPTQFTETFLFDHDNRSNATFKTTSPLDTQVTGAGRQDGAQYIRNWVLQQWKSELGTQVLGVKVTFEPIA